MNQRNHNEHCFPPAHPGGFSFDFPHSIADWNLYHCTFIVIGVCTLLSTIISVAHFLHHLRYYHKPSFQRHITRILLICPIYAINSFFSFRLYWLSVFINVTRDCYEAYVIYNFFCLLIHMLGGPQHAKVVFDSLNVIRLPVPLCFVKFYPTRRTLLTLKRLALQYVFVRPVAAVVASILHLLGRYCPGNWWPTHGYIYISIIAFGSVTLAMFSLITFYFVTQDHLKPFNPVPKFIAVKSTIFLNFWQSVCISGLVYLGVIHGVGNWSTDNISMELQNALTCVEMLFASLFHLWAFSAAEYRQLGRTPSMWRAFCDVLSVKDVWEDTVESFGSLRHLPLVRQSHSNTYVPLDQPEKN